MKLGTTYYRLLDFDFRKVMVVYRIRHSDVGLWIERWDPSISAWTEGPSSFLAHVNNGEDGADVIPKAEAMRLIAAGLPAPIVQNVDRPPQVRPLPAGRRLWLDGPGAELPRYTSVFDPGADEPQFRPAGNMRSVDGILESLGVAGRSKWIQRKAIARAWAMPAIRVLLAPWAAPLRDAGLLDTEA